MPRQSTGPRLIPALLGAAGAGLIGSGLFVTDPVGGFPPAALAAPGENGSSQGTDAAASPSLQGSLHNLCAIPIFAGIPVAGLASALAATRRKDYGWACYSALSSLSMAGSFLLFGAAFSCRACAPPPPKGRHLPAHVDRSRVRLAVRLVASLPVLRSPPLKRLSSAVRVDAEPAQSTPPSARDFFRFAR